MADEQTMLFWIAAACRLARERGGRIASQVAASAVADQSTISRFEHHTAWPKKDGGADRIVSAYADDLDIEAFELWHEAVRLWGRHRSGESLEDLGIERTSRRNGRKA